MALVELEKISKAYTTEEVVTQAVDEVNLMVEAGSFVAIMGPSGCGKTTLLNLIGLLDTPDSGRYIFDGQVAHPAGLKQKNQLIKHGFGFVFQQFNLINELSIYDNVQLPLFYRGWNHKQRKARVNQVLDELGIGHRSQHRPQQLSGGQQQRAAIARALVGDPIIILADEPTGNLDSNNGTQVMEILTELNRVGKTIIIVTHAEKDAAYAHRIIQMVDGQIKN